MKNMIVLAIAVAFLACSSQETVTPDPDPLFTLWRIDHPDWKGLSVFYVDKGLRADIYYSDSREGLYGGATFTPNCPNGFAWKRDTAYAHHWVRVVCDGGEQIKSIGE